MKRETWWIVIINLSGISEPIRCVRKSADEKQIWDKTGDYSCDMRRGLWPLTKTWNNECFKFQTPDKNEAQVFYQGARAVADRLKFFLG